MCSKVGGCDAGDPEEQWLRADLASNVAGCTLADHARADASAPANIHGSSTEWRAFWQALYDYNADLILSGERTRLRALRAADAVRRGRCRRGIRQITVGTGGRSHYGFRSQVLANSQVRNADTFGVLDVTLRRRLRLALRPRGRPDVHGHGHDGLPLTRRHDRMPLTLRHDRCH